MPTRELYLEDFVPGLEFRTAGVTITDGQIIDFALRFDPQPFHLDVEAAGQSIFGGLIASGWHTGAMLIRMITEHFVRVYATMGAMGFDDLRWLKPVRPGDVLSVETRIGDKIEPRRRRDFGIVKVGTRVLNQHGEAVMTLTSLVLFQRRPPA